MRRLAFLSLLSFAIFACSTESTDDGVGGQGGGPSDDEDACCTLGAVCHMAGEAPAEVEECHQIGHTGDQSVCSAEYDRCRQVCEGVTDNPVPHACQ
jgi:hypothetical protein